MLTRHNRRLLTGLLLASLFCLPETAQAGLTEHLSGLFPRASVTDRWQHSSAAGRVAVVAGIGLATYGVFKAVQAGYKYYQRQTATQASTSSAGEIGSKADVPVATEIDLLALNPESGRALMKAIQAEVDSKISAEGKNYRHKRSQSDQAPKTIRKQLLASTMYYQGYAEATAQDCPQLHSVMLALCKRLNLPQPYPKIRLEIPLGPTRFGPRWSERPYNSSAYVSIIFSWLMAEHQLDNYERFVAIMAHELAHIKYRHSQWLVLARFAKYSLNNLFISSAVYRLRSAYEQQVLRAPHVFYGAFALTVVSSELIYHYAERQCEFAADQAAFDLGFGKGLMAGLQNDGCEQSLTKTATALSQCYQQRWWHMLQSKFSSHPTPAKRVAYLQQLQAQRAAKLSKKLW